MYFVRLGTEVGQRHASHSQYPKGGVLVLGEWKGMYVYAGHFFTNLALHIVTLSY